METVSKLIFGAASLRQTRHLFKLQESQAVSVPHNCTIRSDSARRSIHRS